MSWNTEYITLMSSLPYLPSIFSEKGPPPISRIQLKHRLSMLEPDDAQVLKEIDDLTHWDYLPMNKTDESIIIQAEKVLPTFDEPLRELILWRLESRTIVAALRRRQLGMSPPQPGEKWGYGRWINSIVRNWKEPGFQLDKIFPWVTEANGFLKAGDSVGLERMFLERAWKHLSRYGESHYFNFFAVVVYVLKWHLAAQWARYNGVAAVKRFNDMVDLALGEFKDIYD